MRTAIALAAALLATSAFADDATPPAAAPAADAAPAAKVFVPSAHLQAAQRLYQKLDLDAALAELQQAEAGARDNDDETAQILIYRGLIFSDTGKSSEAADQFKRALAIRPWAEVPQETSPRIAKVFSDARKSIWGMAKVSPPPRKSPAGAPNAMPASGSADAPKAEPAVAK